MTDLLNQKIKLFRPHKGRTSLKQIGLILLAALFFIGLVWLGGWGVKESGQIAPRELSETEKELKLQEQAAEIVAAKDFDKCGKCCCI